MIIGFDGRYAEGDLAGVGKYILKLAVGLSKKGVKVVIFYSKKPKFEIKEKNIYSKILPVQNRYIFEQILLPIALKKEKVDLYHAPGNVGIPIFCPVPAVLSVHDIIPLEIKDYFSYSPAPVLSKLSYLFRLKTSIFKADKIVVVSNYVGAQLIKKLNVDAKKITVIYSGAPEIIKGGKLPKELIGKKYILNHGGIDIRKNLGELIDAFNIFHKKYPDVKLVIMGKNKRIRDELNLQIGKLKIDKSIIFPGYVDEKTLWAIIKNALGICYPTLSEGFGFPILEGFGARVPVISSKTSAIPEIAGKAALLINPKNRHEIVNALEKVLNDKKLRQKMILEGQKEYHRFDWKKAANEYLNLYNGIK